MKNWLVIIIICVVLRIILSLITFHPDMQAFNLAGKLVASGNILNLYDYLPNLPNGDPIKNLAVFNYPPAIYLYHGIFNFTLGSIFGQVNQFLLDNPSNYGNFQFNIHLLPLKLPYLIFDLLIVMIFWKYFESKKKATVAILLWVFNPINLYATYMMGQFDIIPTFFTLFSVYLISKNRLSSAALSLGFGIAFKLFPIFLVIPLIIYEKGFLKKCKLFILSITPYFLSIIPYISSHNFRSSALVANQTSKSLYAIIPVSGEETIFLFPTFLLFFYLFIWYARKKINIWKAYTIPLLLFFLFTHYHPQWLIWLTPFLILDFLEYGSRHLIPNLLILFSWFGSLFFFDPSLTVGIFAPIAPTLHNSPSIWTLLSLKVDFNFLRSILQTIFVSVSLYKIYQYLPLQRDE